MQFLTFEKALDFSVKCGNRTEFREFPIFCPI